VKGSGYSIVEDLVKAVLFLFLTKKDPGHLTLKFHNTSFFLHEKVIINYASVSSIDVSTFDLLACTPSRFCFPSLSVYEFALQVLPYRCDYERTYIPYLVDKVRRVQPRAECGFLADDIDLLQMSSLVFVGRLVQNVVQLLLLVTYL